MPPPIPPQCQALATELDQLKQERADLQAQLQTAATPQKAALASQIKHLNFLINAKKPALDACMLQYGGPPPPAPIASTLTGTLTLTTDRGFVGEPFTDAVTWGLLFDGPRTHVFVTSFLPWMLNTTALANTVSGPFFSGFFGPNITTIRQTGGGSGVYSKPGGLWNLPLTLRFDHSRDVPIYEEDSDLTVALSTANPGGSPVNTAGLVTLAGMGVFIGGWLGGVMCTIKIAGKLSPVP